MNKLQEAEQRRKQLQNEKLTTKLTNGVESFKKKWMLRGEAQKKNIKLYQFYEEEKCRNINVCNLILCMKSYYINYFYFIFPNRLTKETKKAI